MPVYQDRKSGRLYIEFQYKGYRHKERLPKGTTRKDAEEIERSRRIAIKARGTGHVYFVRLVRGDSFKIGFTIRDPKERIRDIQSAIGQRLELLATRPGTRDLEQSLLLHFRKARKLGEWFWSTDMDRDVARFLTWNETIGKLDVQMYMDERMDRQSRQRAMQMQNFIDSAGR